MKNIIDYLSGRTRAARVDLLVLFGLFGFAFFQFLGKLPLLEPDEARYAEVPREMLESGDFITPHLNYVKYFEKPPLHYWLNALSFSLFGQNEFAARCSTALFALLCVLITYWAGRKLYGRREGLFGALVLGTSVGYMVQARYNIIDMTLAACMSASLFFFLLATRENEQRKGLFYHLFYLFAALAVLAKGLIGFVLPGGIIFFWLLFTRRWKVLGEMRLLTGIPLFFAVAAPWFVLVSQRNPEFPQFFFIHEHFQRFATKVHRRYQPPWFFIPVLLGCMLPWAFFLPATFRKFWRERKTGGNGETLFLAIWAVLIFVFFSASSSKLVAYILPIFPALALLIGKLFSDAAEDFAPIRRHAAVIAGFIALAGAAVVLYPHIRFEPRISIVGFTVIGGLFLVQGILALRETKQRAAIGLFCALALTSYLTGIAGPPFVFADKVHKKSSEDLAQLVKENLAPGTRVICYSGYNQGLPWYAGTRVAVVGDRNELEFGSNQGDHSEWFFEADRFNALWDQGAPILAITNRKGLEKIRSAVKRPILYLGGEGGRLLITNVPRPGAKPLQEIPAN